MILTRLLTSWRAKTNRRAENSVAAQRPDGDGPADYCVELSKPEELDPEKRLQLRSRLELEMALVPGGETRLAEIHICNGQSGIEVVTLPGEPQFVEATYIDKLAVTNADYLRFVASGCYRNVDLWATKVLPYVPGFVDSTGHAGPAFWSHGEPPARKLDHPVVGVSWFEADAYARWIGKRLPTSVEWQRAGTWPGDGAANPNARKYPWGEFFNPGMANLWSSGLHTTTSAGDLRNAATPNGVCQLSGNVWEWTQSDFAVIGQGDRLHISLDDSTPEIRGGAFDTYFESQATCWFRSCKPRLSRTANLGFRCCVGADELVNLCDPFSLACMAEESPQ